MTKLIPKHLTPANPLVLQNDNTLVVQPVLPIPSTNINWNDIYTTFIPVAYFLSTNKSNR